MQDTTGYGVGWSNNNDSSDIESVCGDYPAFSGCNKLQIYKSFNCDSDYNVKRRNMQIQRFTVGILIILLASCQPYNPGDERVNAPEEFLPIRGEIIQLVKEGVISSFAVAVVQGNDIIWKESFVLDNDTTVLSGGDAVFPLASLTKTMSATVMLMLVEEELLSLEDPLEKYLPGQVKYFGRECPTIRELLNMTAGIPHGWVSFNTEGRFASLNNKEIMRYYGISVFPAGIYEYSNYAFGLVEAIIENVTNSSYEQVLKEKLFNPLGMNNSYVTPAPKNHAYKDSLLTSKYASMFLPSGAAGVYSSLSDLIRYAQLHLGQKDESILSAESLYSLHYDKIYPYTISSLGWGSISLDDSTTWLITNGSFPETANSHLTLIPEKEIAVICLANRDFQSSADIMAIRIADVLAPEFASKAFAKIEAYEANMNNEFKPDSIGGYISWTGSMNINETKIPVEFRYQTDTLFFSFNRGQWNSVKNVVIDHQSIIHGDVSLSLANPLTGEIEDIRGSINLLYNEDSMQGYLSAYFSEEDSYNMAIPYYLEFNRSRPESIE